MAGSNSLGPAREVHQSVDAAREAHQLSGARRAAQVSHAMRLAIVALLLALVVRILVMQPFAIPSGSMMPGLEAGDYILVNKAAYGWSRAALPFQFAQAPDDSGGDLLDGLASGLPERVAGRAPERGDVIVFVGPEQADYVKRVIAYGGDRVAMAGGRVILNGRMLPCTALESGHCLEQHPGGRRYVVRPHANGPHADHPEMLVPAGRYFVLGDNRGHSADSRLTPGEGGVGLVADRQLVGRAERIFLALRGGVRWDRVGQRIR